MPKLKINLSYELDGNPEGYSMQEVTKNYIVGSVHSKHPQGLNNNQGLYRRILGRVIAKLNKAIDADSETIDLEVAELELVKKAVAEGMLPAAASMNVSLLEDAIEEAGKEPKPKEK